MSVYINGEKKELKIGSALQSAIDLCNITSPFAVVVNKVLVTKAKYHECELKEGDVIEIVYPMQGG